MPCQRVHDKDLSHEAYKVPLESFVWRGTHQAQSPLSQLCCSRWGPQQQTLPLARSPLQQGNNMMRVDFVTYNLI